MYEPKFDRVLTACGSHPEIKGCFFMSGPQCHTQILPEVNSLLARPGIKQVIVVFDHGLGERIESFTGIPNENKG